MQTAEESGVKGLKGKRGRLGRANSIGAKVAALRKERGMPQKELLVQLQLRGIKMSQSSLSKLEGQTRKVKGEEMAALMKIFSVPVEELYPKRE